MFYRICLIISVALFECKLSKIFRKSRKYSEILFFLEQYRIQLTGFFTVFIYQNAKEYCLSQEKHFSLKI